MPRVTFFYCYAECNIAKHQYGQGYYAECRDCECRVSLFGVTNSILGVVTLNFFTLIVIMLSVIMLRAVVLVDITVRAAKSCVIVANVVAPH